MCFRKAKMIAANKTSRTGMSPASGRGVQHRCFESKACAVTCLRDDRHEALETKTNNLSHLSRHELQYRRGPGRHATQVIRRLVRCCARGLSRWLMQPGHSLRLPSTRWWQRPPVRYL
jgi:hypothetical protein